MTQSTPIHFIDRLRSWTTVFLVTWLVIWPGAHIAGTHAAHINPWNFGGWGMYSFPEPSTHVAAFVFDGERGAPEEVANVLFADQGAARASAGELAGCVTQYGRFCPVQRHLVTLASFSSATEQLCVVLNTYSSATRQRQSVECVRRVSDRWVDDVASIESETVQ